MNAETILTNAVLVLPDAMVPGHVVRARRAASPKCSRAVPRRRARSIWTAIT